MVTAGGGTEKRSVVPMLARPIQYVAQSAAIGAIMPQGKVRHVVGEVRMLEESKVAEGVCLFLGRARRMSGEGCMYCLLFGLRRSLRGWPDGIRR